MHQEKQEPQDGRIIMYPDYNIRVSSQKNIYGEKFVLRLLKKNEDIRSIFDLGFPNDDKLVKEAFNKKNSITVIAAPTGEGKTTTLYSIIDYLNKPEINIIDGACSKGYETYTLAMMLDKIGKKVNITGFDIGNQAITEAKKGVFLIKKLCGNEDTIEAYRLGMDAYNDDYLAFSNTSPLNLKQQEYRKVFYDFFTEIQNYKEKRSLFERMREILFSKFTPYFKTKAFKIKPEKADTCKFVQGNILKLDEIVPAHSADVLLFRNALYHLTTQEGPLGFKVQLPEAYIIPTVEDVVKQVDQALAPKGIFVIGDHPSDHTLTAGKTLYSELEKHNFSPVFKNSDGSMSLIWMKNR